MSTTDVATYARPGSLDEALARLDAHVGTGARPLLLAGGTDWMVERHAGVAAMHTATVDLGAVPEIARIDRTERDGHAHYEIGAAVPYLAFRRHAGLVRDVPLMAAMAREVGALQIQARGTLGGNLATGSPAADGVCAISALDASITVASHARGRRTVPFSAFQTGYKCNVMAPDELIVSVGFDAPGPYWYWRKVGTRLAQAISKVALAATARIDAAGTVTHAAFGMASVGPVTARLPTVAQALVGQRRDAVDARPIAAALAADIAPLDDVRSTREYRLHVAQRLLDRFVASLADAR